MHFFYSQTAAGHALLLLTLETNILEIKKQTI